MMRHTDKMRMGLAMAGLIFCFSSASQFLVQHANKKQGLPTAAKTTSIPTHDSWMAHVDAASAKDVDHLKRLQEDSLLQWLSVGTNSSTHLQKIIAKADNPQLFTAITKSIQRSEPSRGTHHPIRSIIVFYRRDGSMDWVVDVASDNTLFDPVTHRYLHPPSNIINLVLRGRLT